MAAAGAKLAAVFLDHRMAAAFWAGFACDRRQGFGLFLDEQIALLRHHHAHILHREAFVGQNAEHGVTMNHQSCEVGHG